MVENYFVDLDELECPHKRGFLAAGVILEAARPIKVPLMAPLAA